MPIYMECRHIKANGDKCESPALRGGYFCYFHSRLKRLGTTKQQPAGQDEPLELLPLEDSCAIQLALSKVVCAIASGKLDPRRAGMLLYGLQIASQNARNAGSAAFESVDEVILTADGDELGPLQMRCDDETECESCDSKDHCDEVENIVWEAELEQLEKHAGELREEQGEKQLPEPPRSHEPRSLDQCTRNCRAVPGSPCSEANLVTSIQPLGRLAARQIPPGHASSESG